MYKVAVIVPIYHVEKYIVRCAESLFRQTLDDIQFIFVDDASRDKSVLRLKQTLERFPQRKTQTIILHHPENMGLPTARATGLAYVEAPYVAHCDSDDYVEPDMYEKLYEYAIQNDSDMVICGRIHHFDGREHAELDKPIRQESFIYSFLYGRLSPCVWTRLTRTNIYCRVQFPKENFIEDFVQTAQLLTYASRITFINDCLYHHVRNPHSITNDMNKEVIAEKLRQVVANFDLMHDFIVRHHPVKEKDFVLRKNAIRQYFFLFDKQRTVRKQLLQTFPDPDFLSLFNLRITWRQRLSLLLLFLRLYPTVRQTLDFIRNNLYCAHTAFSSAGKRFWGNSSTPETKHCM